VVATSPATLILAKAIELIGSGDVICATKAISYKAVGHRQALEQSPRPEGPYFTTYDQLQVTLDFEHQRFRQETSTRGFYGPWWQTPEWQTPPTSVIDFNSDPKPVGATAQRAAELLALDPARVLLEAMRAPDLRQLADIQLHGFTHHVFEFHKAFEFQKDSKRHPVRVLINAATGWPSAVEITRARPYDTFWAPWGDVTTRFIWELWVLQKNGLVYPQQITMESNGQVERQFMIDQLTINPELRAEDFQAPPLTPQQRARTSTRVEDWAFGTGPAVEIVPGIVQVPGLWNVGYVRDDDGVWIIEGPISSAYSAHAIDEAKKRWPGVKIVGVISTSDAWPHVGGLREYAAEGIAVYAFHLTVPLLQRLFAAPHSEAPDLLARSPKPPQIHPVSKRTTMGRGGNRFELIPILTPSADRLIAIYFPEHKLLYTSDIFQFYQDQLFLPAQARELQQMIGREKLEVQTVFGMHLEPMAWSKVEELIKTAVQR
jgi:hypothetical protein